MNTGDPAGRHKGLVFAGASLLWRHQEILWWMFAVNVVLGGLGTLGAARTLNASLGHCLAGNRLVKGFDLGMLDELLRLPEANFLRSRSTAFGYAILFAVFMLFVSGGIFETFRQDRRLTTGDFFAASGAFFWRFVRLMLFSIVPFALIGSVYQNLDKLSDYLGDKAIADEVGVFLSLASIALFLLLALAVRLWFDVAKVRAVALNERGMWGNLWSAHGIIWKNLGNLYWMYFRISLVAAIALLIGFCIWTKLPPTAIPLTFILLEFIILSQLGARLWQTASATVWYKAYAEPVPVERLDYTTPQPEEVIVVTETTVVAETDSPPIREPETPPKEVSEPGEGAKLRDDL